MLILCKLGSFSESGSFEMCFEGFMTTKEERLCFGRGTKDNANDQRGCGALAVSERLHSLAKLFYIINRGLLRRISLPLVKELW